MSLIPSFINAPRRANRALVADEDPSVVRLLGCFLGNLGWNVESALDHEAAIRSFHSSRQDLLICDVHLKGWYGIETAKNCLAMHPLLRVVMISSLSDHLDHARKAGFGHCFRKPFDLKALKAVIEPPFQDRREVIPVEMKEIPTRFRNRVTLTQLALQAI